MSHREPDPAARRPPPSLGQRGATRIVVFGRRAVLEALRSPHVEVERVCVASDAAESLRRQVRRACTAAGLALDVGRARDVHALSGEPRHDQGVAAVAQLARIWEVEAFVAECTGSAARRPTRLLALDCVTNPQNVGMIVRSAVAAGMSGVLWPLRGIPWIQGLVVKASACAVYQCPIVRCETLTTGLLALQGAGFEVIGLSADEAPELGDAPAPHRAVYVVGSETTGLSPETLGVLDSRVRIPMAGGVESLNVAVAASLVCFHAGIPGTRAKT